MSFYTMYQVALWILLNICRLLAFASSQQVTVHLLLHTSSRESE